MASFYRVSVREGGKPMARLLVAGADVLLIGCNSLHQYPVR
jgi:hypothetical protein